MIAPVAGEGERHVVAEIDRLGEHSPARAIVLRDHGHDRLDAEVVLDCQERPEAGRVGVCHDRVLLSADALRLAHVDSLIAPILVSELPVVAWLPEPAHVHNAAVARRADHLVIDSGGSEPGTLDHAAALRPLGPVHDVAWGRLERWRAAVAGAWDPPERRAVLPELRGVELRHGADTTVEALLLGGWIAARAGLDPRAVSMIDGAAGIESVRFSTATRDVDVEPPPSGANGNESFILALAPTRSYRSGYPESLAVAHELRDLPS